MEIQIYHVLSSVALYISLGYIIYVVFIILRDFFQKDKLFAEISCM